ncbi:MAG: hypothetical protein ABSG92_06560 [Conexivisphaerales archaeon]|jgi:hypothetical protein
MTMVDTNPYQAFVIPGLILIVIGVIFLAVPLLARFVPSVEKLPPIILWVYRSDGFYFATSPILLVISIVSIALYLLRTRS